MSSCEKPDLTKYKLWVMCGDRAGFHNREQGYCDTTQDYFISTDHPHQRNPMVVNDGGMFSGIHKVPSDTIHKYMVQVGRDNFYPLARLVGNAEKHMEIRKRAKPDVYAIDFIPEEARPKNPDIGLTHRCLATHTSWDWTNDFVLVQFKIDCRSRPKDIHKGKIQFSGSRVQTRFNEDDRLVLAGDSVRDYSAPVLVPYSFYNKLSCHVEKFTKAIEQWG